MNRNNFNAGQVLSFIYNSGSNPGGRRVARVCLHNTSPNERIVSMFDLIANEHRNFCIDEMEEIKLISEVSYDEPKCEMTQSGCLFITNRYGREIKISKKVGSTCDVEIADDVAQEAWATDNPYNLLLEIATHLGDVEIIQKYP